MIQADLETLKTLYQTLKDDVQRSDDIQKLTDTALQNAVWESTNAQQFRDAWTEFKPQLIKFEQAFATAATDVANNYNNNVDANGENLEHLAPVEAIGGAPLPSGKGLGQHVLPQTLSACRARQAA